MTMMIVKRLLRSALTVAESNTSININININNAFSNRRRNMQFLAGVGAGAGSFTSNDGHVGSLLTSPSWSLSQRRAAKASGSEVRAGNVIQRKGRIYQVIKAQHTQQGRGGATIQVELRDVDSGNKVTERFRTDEAIERVYVEEKSLKYLYSEGDMVVLTDPKTFDQIELPKEMFGKAAVYLQDDMTVTVQYYDERPVSASVPQRVTCTVVEAQTPMKGLSVNAQYKKVVLDNGLTVLAPPFIVAGHAIVINTTDDSYMTRAK